jgi:uncharacterized protein (DUF952 family)
MFPSVHLVAMLIYKIMTAPQWAEFQKLGTFHGAPIDLADGFIHFSTATQMKQTAALHFAGQTDLHLAWCEGDDFGDDLKWEVSRGGDQFPHLFAKLHMDQVQGHADIPLVDGVHQFPNGH